MTSDPFFGLVLIMVGSLAAAIVGAVVLVAIARLFSGGGDRD